MIKGPSSTHMHGCKQEFKVTVHTCSGYTLPFISATVFLETAGGKVWAAIFKLTTMFVPLAAILAIISASSTVMQAVGIFSTPKETSNSNNNNSLICTHS